MTLTPEQIAKLRQDLADAETALDTPPVAPKPEPEGRADGPAWSNGTGSGVNHYSTP